MHKYYEAPSLIIFDELKNAAMKIWKSYDDTYGYASNKIRQIKNLQNYKDNFMFIYAMFDWQNQEKIRKMLGPECLLAIDERMDQ